MSDTPRARGELTEKVELAVEEKVAPTLHHLERKLRVWGAVGTLVALGFGAAVFLFLHFASASNVEKFHAEASAKQAEATKKHEQLDAGLEQHASDIAVLQVQQANTDRNFEWLRLQVTEIAKATRARRVPGPRDE